MATVTTRNLIQRGNVWFVKWRVPVYAVKAFGQTTMSKTTGHADQLRAALYARPILAEWKRRAELIRLCVSAPDVNNVQAMSATYRAAEKADTELEYLTDVVDDFIIPKLEGLGVPAMVIRRAMNEANGNIGEALDLLEGHNGARQVSDDLSVIIGARTPFLTSLEEWKGLATLKPRNLNQYASDLQAFGHDKSVQEITHELVQSWADDLARTGISPTTIKRKLTTFRTYWEHLQQRGMAPKRGDNAEPFTGIQLPRKGRIGASGKPTEARKPFSADEVVRLWGNALAQNDKPLAALIAIGAFTGGRIEELCQLKKTDMGSERGVNVLRLSSKSQAGNRSVPIHRAIQALVQQLTKAAQDGRWLIHSTSANQFDERSVPLGKRFGRLKAKMGYGPELVFHSIRKTVATLLEDAQAPEGIAADIVGHKKTSMTYGLYSGGSSIETRAEWMEKALRYPGMAIQGG